jgi:hypothetical protein
MLAAIWRGREMANRRNGVMASAKMAESGVNEAKMKAIRLSQRNNGVSQWRK